MSPMCQYSAERDGRVNDWHFVHYGSRAVGGVGLVVVEATSVESRGRLSTADVGIWDDGHIEGLRRIARFVQSQGAKIGIQLAHAGRKADCGEELVAPSGLRHSEAYPVPRALAEDEILEVVEAFGQGARRAMEAGFDLVEIHGAHGYLVQQFLSPLANRRQDRWGLGGGRPNPFLREVLSRVRKEIGWEVPLWLRVSGSEYDPDGLGPEDVAHHVLAVRDQVDLVDVSSGGMVVKRVEEWPGYQAPLAETVKSVTGLPVAAVGMLKTPELADYLVRSGKADVISVGRGLLRNPYWSQAAAEDLGVPPEVPVQYVRAYRKDFVRPIGEDMDP